MEETPIRQTTRYAPYSALTPARSTGPRSRCDFMTPARKLVTENLFGLGSDGFKLFGPDPPVLQQISNSEATEASEEV
jgi:hypothetical protein